MQAKCHWRQLGGRRDVRTLVLDDVAPLVGDALGGLLGGLGGEDEEAVAVADHVAEQRPVAAALGHAPDGEHVAGEPRGVEHPGEAHGRLHVVLHEDGHHLGAVPGQEALHLPEHVHRRLLPEPGEEPIRLITVQSWPTWEGGRKEEGLTNAVKFWQMPP